MKLYASFKARIYRTLISCCPRSHVNPSPEEYCRLPELWTPYVNYLNRYIIIHGFVLETLAPSQARIALQGTLPMTWWDKLDGLDRAIYTVARVKRR